MSSALPQSPAPTAIEWQTSQSAETFISSILGGLLIVTLGTGVLMPITISLFASRSRMWKTPVFIANVFALTLGFALGGVSIHVLVCTYHIVPRFY